VSCAQSLGFDLQPTKNFYCDNHDPVMSTKKKLNQKLKKQKETEAMEAIAKKLKPGTFVSCKWKSHFYEGIVVEQDPERKQAFIDYKNNQPPTPTPWSWIKPEKQATKALLNAPDMSLEVLLPADDVSEVEEPEREIEVIDMESQTFKKIKSKTTATTKNPSKKLKDAGEPILIIDSDDEQLHFVPSASHLQNISMPSGMSPSKQNLSSPQSILSSPFTPSQNNKKLPTTNHPNTNKLDSQTVVDSLFESSTEPLNTAIDKSTFDIRQEWLKRKFDDIVVEEEEGPEFSDEVLEEI
jgi:hypothetical protein